MVSFEPKVYLVCRPQLEWGNIEKFLAAHGGPWEREEPGSEGELLCELMGRMCYGSFGDKQGRKSTRSYLENVVVQGHGSVLEHANWSFLVAGAGRGYTHQQVRHRAGWAYSQESTHFVEYSNHEKVVVCLGGVPIEYVRKSEMEARASIQAYKALLASIKSDFAQAELYQDCSGAATKRKKAACGAARALLPNALESKIGFTANARALRHFVEMRGGEENTVEIRYVAAKVADIMAIEAPILFQEYERGWGADGWPVVSSRVHGRKKV